MTDTRTAPVRARSTSTTSTSRGSLTVDHLSVRFRLRGGVVAAVNDISFSLEAGHCLALVGESGCGKSVLIGALLGLLPGNADTTGTAHLRSGSAQPIELLQAPERVLARIVRGRQIGLVPQSPASHLTPVRTVGAQLREVLRTLQPDVADVPALAVETAGRVGLPAQALARYPHELSGGMAQRAATALALAGRAWLLLADEPTTGLDRPLVDQTLDQLRSLTDEGCAVLMITHDLAAAARISDTIAVMYAGRLVEVGPTDTVLRQPLHPYTAGLLEALPERGFRPIPGMTPELTSLPRGCAFAERCKRRADDCVIQPELRPPAGSRPLGHGLGGPGEAPAVACHHPC